VSAPVADAPRRRGAAVVDKHTIGTLAVKWGISLARSPRAGPRLDGSPTHETSCPCQWSPLGSCTLVAVPRRTPNARSPSQMVVASTELTSAKVAKRAPGFVVHEPPAGEGVAQCGLNPRRRASCAASKGPKAASSASTSSPVPSRHHRYRGRRLTPTYRASALGPIEGSDVVHLKGDVTLPVSLLIATRRVLNGRVRSGKRRAPHASSRRTRYGGRSSPPTRSC
jgi:hypothetical protein